MEERVAKPIQSQTTTTDVVVPLAPEAPKVDTPVDPNSPEERAESPTDPWQTSPLFYELSNFLGVESREYDALKDQISVITDWAVREANSNKLEDITHKIRELEEKLQPPAWGEKRVNHIYRFLRLESRFDATRKALGAYTKTGKWS